MRTAFVVRSLFWIAVFALPGRRAGAQQAATATPQVVTVGRGEVSIKPDRAQVQFSVETRAPTATAAATENSRRQRAVLDTLQRLGVSPDQLQTANLQVTPEMIYPGQGLPPRVSGYVARNSVQVEVLKLDHTGVLVDAGLAKGATGIGGLQFYSSRAVFARREALAKAVLSARLDAESMAKAAGCELGTLIEISANAPSDGPVFMAAESMSRMKSSSDMAPTPVNPGEIRISEVVTVRWGIKP